MIAKKIVGEIKILEKYRDIIQKTETIRSLGTVTRVVGRLVYSKGPEVRLGDLCHISPDEEGLPILAEVVGFTEKEVLLSPLQNMEGIYPGCRVISSGTTLQARLSPELLGRVINGLGEPLDNKSKIVSAERRSLYAMPPNPLDRPLITKSLPTGIRAIDGFLTLGRGQRIGIFAGSGVGKSTLLGMIARQSLADVNVIALIGERGREVGEFLQRDLGEHGRRKSVVVVASSNESAMHRVRAAYMAQTIAEYFRDQGLDVLFMMDSLTRLAMAQREVGLAAGEPATTKGYPPSVFALLPELLERAGNAPKGSITAIYTVLVEADDINDPIADASRGILDGHIVLSRRLANQGHYPAISITESVSRSMPMVTSKEHLQTANQLRELLATYQQNEELIQMGVYSRGSNPLIDQAIACHESLSRFLKQDVDETTDFETIVKNMKDILTQARQTRPIAAVRRGAA
ncbi:MAG: FliI/YscN family ATPase [Leptospiraceae bacterium]|nr:FliI/YscN family ATPase [Leptospiraceae bacterium]MDW8305973.1 FliI/YscN family ATPase [Leptospiraceae bacterium]